MIIPLLTDRPGFYASPNHDAIILKTAAGQLRLCGWNYAARKFATSDMTKAPTEDWWPITVPAAILHLANAPATRECAKTTSIHQHEIISASFFSRASAFIDSLCTLHDLHRN